jgi:hypothetical protein
MIPYCSAIQLFLIFQFLVAGHVVYIGEKENAYEVVVGKVKVKSKAVPVHAMKACRGSRDIAPLIFKPWH